MKFKKIEKQKLFAHGENLLIRGNKSVKYLSVGFWSFKLGGTKSDIYFMAIWVVKFPRRVTQIM